MKTLAVVLDLVAVLPLIGALVGAWFLQGRDRRTIASLEAAEGRGRGRVRPSAVHVVSDDEEAVGMGRILGDGGRYLTSSTRLPADPPTPWPGPESTGTALRLGA